MKNGRMKKILSCNLFIILFIIPILQGCAHLDANQAMGPKGAQSIFVYMCGSTLETKNGAASKNIQEMLDNNIPSSTTVVIQTGGAKKWRVLDIDPSRSQRYLIKDGELTLLSENDKQNMGESKTLSDFLKWGVETYPAEKMGVILWDHGGGSLSGVCFDENYNMDSLSLTELDAAFASAGEIMTDEFEYIGFDACLMANYETAYIASKYARNMIASEELEPSGGWDYESVTTRFADEAYYENVLQAYQKKCEAQGKQAYTLSHIDLTQFFAIQTAFDLFAENLLKVAPSGLKPIADAATNAITFGYNSRLEGYSNLIDLADFAQLLQQDNIKQAIEKSVTAVNSKDKQGAYGLSVYYPVRETKFVQNYIENTISEPYCSFLNSFYTVDSEASLIHFTDKGSDADGEFHISLSDDSVQYVSNVEYYLYQFKSVSDYEEKIYGLGSDSDLIQNAPNSYTTSFEGKWVALNDTFLNCTVIDMKDGVITFSSPVLLNNQSGTLRFSFRLSDGSLSVQGFLPADSSGASERLQSVKPGDSITVLYEERTPNYTVNLIEGNRFVIEDELRLSVKPLPDGYFQSYIVVTDIFGKQYYSNDAVLLKSNGHITIKTISDEVDHGLV